MNIAWLGIKGDFSNDKGYGVCRYMYELYNRLNEIQDLEVDKIEINKSLVGVNLETKHYDIIHTPYYLQYPDIKDVRDKRLIYFVTIHDFAPLVRTDVIDIEKRKDWLKSVSCILTDQIKDADCLIVNSTQTKEEALSLGCKESKIHVINLGIDERFVEAPIIIPERKNFKVGYMGRASKRKNVSMAVRAFAAIEKQDSIFEIWGNYSAELAETVKVLSSSSKIILKGFARESNIINIYDSFDVFVFPSMYEGFGLPILEAQARGLPVIICKDAIIPKEVRKFCIEVENESHMAQTFQDLKREGYNEKIRTEAMHYARNFSWAKTALRTSELYKSYSR